MDSTGPFGSLGKTFAPTADDAAQAQSSNRLAGDQQAVKVLRFDLPNVIGAAAPAPAALLAPKAAVGGSSLSPDKAIMASVLRSLLGPGADALTLPAAQSALMANHGSTDSPDDRVDDNHLMVSGARSGSGAGAPAPMPMPQGGSLVPSFAFEKGGTEAPAAAAPPPPMAQRGPFGGSDPSEGQFDWKRDTFGGVGGGQT